jgi:two-component system, sensor histidine kinase LadS
LLVVLVNHDDILAEHGRDAADAALVVTAQHLQSISSELDTPSRVDGDRFLLCLEGPIDDHGMKQRGSALIAKGLRQSSFLPHGVKLDYGIVVCLLTGKKSDAKEIFRQMSRYATQMPSEQNRRLVAFDLESAPAL